MNKKDKLLYKELSDEVSFLQGSMQKTTEILQTLCPHKETKFLVGDWKGYSYAFRSTEKCCLCEKIVSSRTYNTLGDLKVAQGKHRMRELEQELQKLRGSL